MLTPDLVLNGVLALITSLLLVILTGWILFRCVGKSLPLNSFEGLFWYALTGVALVSSVYAMIYTGFRSVLIPVPLLILFLIKKYHVSSLETFSWRLPAFFLILSLCISVLFYIQGFISADPEMVRFVGGDYTYYARVAEYLRESGVESSTPEHLVPEGASTAPYHYGDIWFFSFVSNLFNLPTEFGIILVAYPLFSTIFALGLATFVIALWKPKKKWHIFLAIFSIYFSGISTLFIYPTLQGYEESPGNYPKTLLIGCMITAMMVQVLKKDMISLSLLICISGLMVVNIYPTMLLAAFALFTFQLVLKQSPLRDIIFSTIFLVVGLTWFWAFYFFTMDPDSALAVDVNMKTLNVRELFDDLIDGIRYRKGHPVIVLPFVLLMLIVYLRNKNQVVDQKRVFGVLGWLLLLVLSGLFLWLLLARFTPDAPQFYRNLLLPIISIFITISLYTAFSAQWRVGAIIGGCLLVLMVYKNYRFTSGTEIIGKQELEKLKSFMADANDPVILIHKALSEYITIFDYNTRFKHPLPVLNYFYDPLKMESINTVELGLYQTNRAKLQLLRASSFYQFTSPLGHSAADLNRDSSLLRFVEFANPNYLICSIKGGLPPVLKSYLIDSVKLNNFNVYKFRP